MLRLADSQRDTWERIEDIFLGAIDLSGSAREAYLREACQGDERLRREVERMIEAGDGEAELRSVIESEIVSLMAGTPLIGVRLGAYRILRELGSGGMGSVYLAERDDEEFTKRVAIKIVHGAFARGRLVERFRRERQILAQLEHPYIARLLDAGTTAEGVPYLVMEYVDGLPITTHCEKAGLNVDERLALFRKVCSGVQYAHQHLVIHRDLKPGNILVDRSGEPRLLDFGIAKLLDETAGNGRSAEETWHALTPQYASPEQISGHPVTTTSDVYSLGGILFELLAHRPAHSTPEKRPLALMRDVCDTDVPAPGSVQVTGPGFTPLKFGADLDNIVQRAMRRDPDERYATAEHLADDLRCYMENLPVSARPQTLRYRAVKFLGRYRWQCAIAAATAITLISGGIALWRQTRVAELRSTEVRRLANTMLFDLQSQVQSLPGSTAVQVALVNTSLQYLDRLARDSGGDTSLQFELAQAYLRIGDVQGYTVRPSLGRPADAARSYRKGLEIACRLTERSSDPAATVLRARLMQRLGYVSRDGELSEGLRILRDALALAEPVYRANPDNLDAAQLLLDLHSVLGSAETSVGNYVAMETHHRRTLEIAEHWNQVAPSDRATSELATGHVRMTRALQLRGDLAGALAHARQAVSLAEELTAAHPTNAEYKRSLLNSREQLAHVCGMPRKLNLGDMQTAIAEEEKVVALAREMAAADANNATAKSDLIIANLDYCTMLNVNNPQKAEPYCEAGRALIAERVGTGNRVYGDASAYLSAVEWKLGRRERATQLLRKALDIYEPQIANAPGRMDYRVFVINAREQEGRMQLEAGHVTAALESFRQAVATSETLLPAHTFDLTLRRATADAYEAMGQAYAAQSRWRDALEWYQKDLAIWTEWSRWGISSVYDVRRKSQAAALVAQARGAF